MVFNSFEYIFLFLPVAWGLYFVFNRYTGKAAGQLWLFVCSLFFYAWWNILYLPLLLGSILVNFYAGRMLQGEFAAFNRIPRKAILAAGLAFNIGLLGYCKYSNFLIKTINSAAGTGISLLNIYPTEIGFPHIMNMYHRCKNSQSSVMPAHFYFSAAIY